MTGCETTKSTPLREIINNVETNTLYFKHAACTQCQLSAGNNKYAYPLPYIATTGADNLFQTANRPTHNGVDYYPVMEDALGTYNNYNGTPIFSIASGKVIDQDYSATLGNYIVIRHSFNPNGSTTNQYSYSVYEHMWTASSYSVNSNVSIGTIIGYVGNIGDVGGSRTPDLGAHLHFEIRQSNNGNIDNNASGGNYWKNVAVPYNPQSILP